MEAFHNDKKIKTKYLNRVEKHRKADQLIKGTYWENGKGCAVGCTIHDSSHKKYETELGIPEWLARVEDRIFEGLSDKDSKEWPSDFLKAIPIGVDLEQIKRPFLIFIVESALSSFDHVKFPDTLKRVSVILENLKNPNWKPADAAYAAAAAAYAAADADAAYAAAAAAAYAAADAAAAYAAADAAAYAAAAYAAAAAAYAYYWRWPKYESKRQESFKKFADKLLELIRDCK